MSVASLSRIARENAAAGNTFSLLCSIAGATIADPELSALADARPHLVDAIAAQCCFCALAVSKSKAAALAALSVNGKGGAQLDNAVTKAQAAATSLSTSPLQVRIVVVGLGGVATRIVERLLKSRQVPPTSITVVTRQAQFPSAFASVGVPCHNGFTDALPAADCVIVATQPGHFSTAAAAMKKAKMPASALVVSTCAGISAEKVAAELAHPLCVATSVDVDVLSKAAADFAEQDAVLAQYRRATFTASKSVLSSAVPLDVADASLVAGDPRARATERERRTTKAAYPSLTVEFLHKLTFCLAAAAVARGMAQPEAMRLAVQGILSSPPLPPGAAVPPAPPVQLPPASAFAAAAAPPKKSGASPTRPPAGPFAFDANATDATTGTNKQAHGSPAARKRMPLLAQCAVPHVAAVLGAQQRDYISAARAHFEAVVCSLSGKGLAAPPA